MIEAIIFDMDGVLVDTEPHHVKIEKNQFKMNGISISENEHQLFMGTASDAMWKKIAEKHILPKPIEELIEQNRFESLRYFSELDEIPVMPGLIDLLEKLQKKNYPMAVASSSFPEIIDLILVKTGLKKYFQEIVSGEEAGKSKPNPDVFLLAAKKLGVKPKNCLVIEDSFNGIKAAHAAGMSCVAYQSPGVDPKTQKEADAVVKNFEQIDIIDLTTL
jgi:beta-phosphoglucomutase